MEAPNLLAWDNRGTMTLFNHAAEVVAGASLPGLVGAALSADGSQAVALSRDGTVRLMRGDLAPRKEFRTPGPAVAVAIDNHGHHIAVGLADGTITFWNGLGQEGASLRAPSPAASMAFATGHPWLAFAGEAGLAGCADINGELRWREGLPHRLGPIAMEGGAGSWLVPCHGGGLARYGPLGAPHRMVGNVTRCRLAATNHSGTLMAVVDSPGEILLRHAPDKDPDRLAVPASITCLAMDPLGKMIMAGLDDRRILWIRP